MIQDVVIKQLITHPDERGFFRETIRVSDDFFKEGFGQCSHALIYQGVVKAWHIHQVQVDWWYVVSGVLKIALHDSRKDSPTFQKTMELLMGDEQPSAVLRIPPGVAHGYKCIKGPAHILYVMSHTYDPQDEGRIPHNDPAIGYDWLKGPKIT
ncbi:MAG TPA: dTDP-4-dehydrorhamnose 3,5-epimerase family protein [Bacteroidota bacterium]|nr:dTDP-4-dehydrorhamnose 3,5-epimerase family protein [Bacteroidota bacterium]